MELLIMQLPPPYHFRSNLSPVHSISLKSLLILSTYVSQVVTFCALRTFLPTRGSTTGQGRTHCRVDTNGVADFKFKCGNIAG
jgi:hypothetical protein